MSDGSGFSLEKPRLRLAFVVEVGWSQLKRLAAYVRQPAGNQGRADETLQVLTQNLETLQRVVCQVKERGTPVLVVLLPSKDGYQPASDVNAFRATISACSVPFLDLSPNLDGHPGCFVDQVHLNDAGHRVVGNAIAAFLNETRVVFAYARK